MPLQLASVEASDFDTLLTYTPALGGNLIAPMVPRIFPVADDDPPEKHAARNRWSIQQQREIFEDDPSARFLKVTDTDNGEIIAFARWHYYPDGFKEEHAGWELNGKREGWEERWPEGLHKDLYEAIIMPLVLARPQWMGRRAMWVLTTLVTKTSQRKRGAGSMLVQWGVDQGKKDNVPTFLEAAPAAAPLYEKMGFKRVGEQSVDISKFGFEKPVTLSRMVSNDG